LRAATGKLQTSTSRATEMKVEGTTTTMNVDVKTI
jgi:hypothetical protein